MHFTETTYTIPDGYDLTAQVPKSTLMVQIMTAVVLILALIALFIFVGKKYKISIYAIFGGLALYILFFYYVPNITPILYYIPPFSVFSDSIVVGIVVVIISAVLGILGRMLYMKLFQSAGNTMSFHASTAIGFAGAFAVYLAFSSVMDYVNCYTVDAEGLETTLLSLTSSATSQEGYESTVASFYTYITNGTGVYVFRLLEYVILMVYHVAITVPLLAAYTDKESKGWYGFAMGTYSLMMVMRGLRSVGLVHGAVSTIVMAADLGITLYFAVKMFKDYYENEEEPEKKGGFGPRKEEPKKKMPKFGNLSDL